MAKDVDSFGTCSSGVTTPPGFELDVGVKARGISGSMSKDGSAQATTSNVAFRQAFGLTPFNFAIATSEAMRTTKSCTMRKMGTANKLETTGGCLCGGVRYRVKCPLRSIVYCHCRQCRRTSGHFVAAAAVPKNALAIDSDKSLEWFASSESASRGFCRRCGSSLFWLPKAEEHVSIMAGTLDGPTGLEAVEHIYTDDKSDYYELTDGLPTRRGAR